MRTGGPTSRGSWVVQAVMVCVPLIYNNEFAYYDWKRLAFENRLRRKQSRKELFILRGELERGGGGMVLR